MGLSFVYERRMKDYFKTLDRRLKRFPPEESLSLRTWLEDMPVGINLALQILEQLEDLHKKTGEKASDLLREALAELHSKEVQPKELGRRLRGLFEKRLHPTQSSHQERFLQALGELALPPQCQVQAPQNFEGRDFTLRLEFSSLEELSQALQGIQKSLEQSEAWTQLWQF